MSPYVLITPAHNEEQFIGGTIDGVLAQSLLPQKWVIVNDRSTDGTGQVVEKKTAGIPFVTLVNLNSSGGRDFGRKALAFGRALEELKGLDYEYIGNLDADISVLPNYFASLMREFELDPQLGLAGGMVYTKSGQGYITGDKTLDSVGGAVQMFRKGCFEEVGGYLPLEHGGIDAAAEITARMKGWKVRKFPEQAVYEQRRTGTANMGLLKSKIQEGRRFYSLGYGLVFYLLRCIYRAGNPPYVIGSGLAFWGFLNSLLRQKPLALPPELAAYLRREQRAKLKRLFGLRGRKLTC